jgi:hypothetical protein
MVLVAALTVAAVGFPSGGDSGFTDRLMTAIGARLEGGTVSCSIPSSLRVGQHFECHGLDTFGTYTVDVTIVDRRHDFRLSVLRPV